MKLTIFALAAVAIAAPAFAQDASVGESEFRKCKACHMIQDAEGNDIVKGGKTGPNLFNVVGRAAGAQEDFKYSDALLKLGESGEVWNAEDLAQYITDPNAFVEEKVGDASLKTKMTFKLRDKQADVVAFLVQNSPDAPAEGDSAAGGDAAATDAPVTDAPAAEAPASN